MTKSWMTDATRSNLSPLTEMYKDGPNRVIWHITWDELDSKGRGPSFESLVKWFNDQPGRAPHLLWDPFSGKVHQFYPVFNGGKSVATQKYADQPVTKEDQSGSTIYSPNRTGTVCLQIEVLYSPGRVENGKKYPNLKDTPMVGLDKVMAFIRQLDIPDVWPAGVPKASDTGTNRRVSKKDWIKNGGHYGHVHVPWNSHNDPLDIGDVLTRAPAVKPPLQPVPLPPAPTDPYAYRKPIKLNDDAPRVVLLKQMIGWKNVTSNAGQPLIDWVKKFQKKQKLTVDGIVGPKTWAAIRKKFGK